MHWCTRLGLGVGVRGRVRVRVGIKVRVRVGVGARVRLALGNLAGEHDRPPLVGLEQPALDLG